MEIWKDIKGFEGLYNVSNLGRVKSLDRPTKHPRGGVSFKMGKILCFGFKDAGYLFCQLSKNGKAKPFYIHRLVALAFIPNPNEKPEVNHKDGVKSNNHVENLEWSTHSENHKHAFRTGLSSTRGDNSRCRKLSSKDVFSIKYEHKGLTAKQIAIIYGVSASYIYTLRGKTRWGDI